MGFQCWPYKRDYVQGWVGGPAAWELARAGQPAAVDFALGQLRSLFGSRVDRLFAGGSHFMTRWDADPFVRGAYPKGYVSRPWLMVQYVGFATVEETNTRWKALIDAGQRAVSLAFDRS